MTANALLHIGLGRELPVPFVLMGGLVGTRSDSSTKIHNILGISRAVDDWKKTSRVETFDLVAPRIRETAVMLRANATGEYDIAAGNGWSLTGDTSWLPVPSSAEYVMIAGYVRGLALHITRVLSLPHIYVQIGDRKGRLLTLSPGSPGLVQLRHALMRRNAALHVADKELAAGGQVMHS